MRSAGCEFDPNFITNVTCRTRPTRDGSGLSTYMVSGFKKTSDIWVTIRFLYRNSKLRMLPFLQAFDYDACKLVEKKASLDFFTYLFVEMLGKVAPSLYHPCPYSGTAGVEKVNIAHVIESSFPNVIPRGTYKISLRFYAKASNLTYVTMWAMIDSTAIDVMQRFDM